METGSSRSPAITGPTEWSALRDCFSAQPLCCYCFSLRAFLLFPIFPLFPNSGSPCSSNTKWRCKRKDAGASQEYAGALQVSQTEAGCAHTHTDDTNGQVWERGKASFLDSPKSLLTLDGGPCSVAQAGLAQGEAVRSLASPERGLPWVRPHWVSNGLLTALPSQAGDTPRPAAPAEFLSKCAKFIVAQEEPISQLSGVSMRDSLLQSKELQQPGSLLSVMLTGPLPHPPLLQCRT